MAVWAPHLTELRTAGALRRQSFTTGKRRSRPQPVAKPGRALAFKNFGDGLLDYMEAGPKLRKWYGEGERRPQDGGGPELEEEEEPNTPANSILVTDADSPTGELVLLQLILLRLEVTALVKDAAATQHAYGDYVRPIQGRIGDADSLTRALKTARAVVCPSGGLGALPQVLSRSRVRHAVLLSSVGAKKVGFLGKFLGGEQAVLSDPERERALEASGVPLTTVRVGSIVDAPGSTSELSFSQGEAAAGSGEISREDVAQVLVRALQKPPQEALVFAVSGRRTGQPTQWEKLFGDLQEVAAAQ